jgi:hypothetical protein
MQAPPRILTVHPPFLWRLKEERNYKNTQMLGTLLSI